MKRNSIFMFVLVLAVIAGLYAAPAFATDNGQFDINVGCVQYRYSGEVTALAHTQTYPLADMHANSQAPQILNLCPAGGRAKLSAAKPPQINSFGSYGIRIQMQTVSGPTEYDYFEDCVFVEEIYMGGNFHLTFRCPSAPL